MNIDRLCLLLAYAFIALLAIMAIATWGMRGEYQTAVRQTATLLQTRKENTDAMNGVAGKLEELRQQLDALIAREQEHAEQVETIVSLRTDTVHEHLRLTENAVTEQLEDMMTPEAERWVKFSRRLKALEDQQE